MAWYHRLLNLARPERLSRELDRELEFHVAELTDALVAEGMSEEEARRRARLRFGNPTLQKERTRERDVLPWLESLGADARYALRSLRSNPGFAAVAVLSLGLGIGANTAIFSLIDAVLLRPLPVERPGELAQLRLGDGATELTYPLWEAVRERQDVFSGVFAVAARPFDLADGGEARPAAGARVSGEFFGTLGVGAAVGRVLGPADDRRGCAPVAVLGHDFWRSEYGADRRVVGRTLALDGHPFEVVGVAERGFPGVEVGRATQVYVPFCAMSALEGGDGWMDARSNWYVRVLGRTRGLPEAEVAARLAAIAPAVFRSTVPEEWPAEMRASYLRNTLGVEPASNGYSGIRFEYGSALLALMAVVGLVLLIACANVANLLLARATGRRREVAIRLAIGAGRGRLIRQLLTESLLLAALGAALGLGLAAASNRLLLRVLLPDEPSLWLDLSIDGRLLGFTLAVATATALLFGLAPAWRATRLDPQAALKATGRGIVDGRTRFRVGKALVVGQIALSLVLVVGAGLLLGSLRELARLDPGFEPEGVLLVAADLSRVDVPEEGLAGAKLALLERVRALPGVRSASASELTPLSGAGWNNRIEVAGYTPADERDALVFFNAVSDAYFATLGTPLLAGRDLDGGDAPGAPEVALVNETLARKFFGGAAALGGRIGVSDFPGEPTRPVEVVGIVRDSKYRSLREETRPVVYLPLRQRPGGRPYLNLELRAAGPPAALVPTVTAAIAEVSPAISLRYVTLADQVSGTLARERLLASLTGLFGLLALLLAVVGLYGTMAYTVAQRRNEIGIRIALGAARAGVMRLVLGETGRLVAAGIVVGALAAYGAARAMSPFLFGLSPADPVTWGLSALALAAVGVAAGALPAWRAATVDPTTALREE